MTDPPLSPGMMRQRADRIYRVTQYLYYTGRDDWAFRWGCEFHRLATTLKRDHKISVYR